MTDRVLGAKNDGDLLWVRETRFGRWFLGTEIWRQYVLGEALTRLVGMVGSDTIVDGHILDIGCGCGAAAALLDAAFSPERITGIDIDIDMIEQGRSLIRREAISAECVLKQGCATHIPLANESVDLVLCHQLLHHMVKQREALAELNRVLRPGGVMLLAESCRCFIESSIVRWFFRHPYEAQHTADRYIELVRAAGFEVDDHKVVTESPWWSRRDFGLREYVGLWPPAQSKHEPTEVLCIAVKRP